MSLPAGVRVHGRRGLSGGKRGSWLGGYDLSLAAKCTFLRAPLPPPALAWLTLPTPKLLGPTQVEARLRQLEGKLLSSEAGTSKGKEQPGKYDKARQGATPAIVTQPKAYNPAADVVAAPPAAVVEKKVGRALFLT